MVAGVEIMLADCAVADADSNDLTCSLTAINGTIDGLIDANADPVGFQLQCTVASINAALAEATFTATAAGLASVGIDLSDGLAPAVTGANHFMVSLPNCVPLAANASVTMAEDVILSESVAATDADDGTLAYTVVVRPAQGELSLNPDGGSTYTPAVDYSGADVFSFKANDGEPESNVAMVSISVSAVNDAPALVLPLAVQTFGAQAVFSYVLPDFSFADKEAGQLDYSASLSNGDPLPGGRQFDPDTQAFGVAAGMTDVVGGRYESRPVMAS